MPVVIKSLLPISISAFVKAIGSVTTYPDILGLPVKELNTPSNASVIPNPAIVVGLLPKFAQVTSVIPYPAIVVGLPVKLAKDTVVKKLLKFGGVYVNTPLELL